MQGSGRRMSRSLRLVRTKLASSRALVGVPYRIFVPGEPPVENRAMRRRPRASMPPTGRELGDAPALPSQLGEMTTATFVLE